MFGIGIKSAKLIASAALALGVGAVGIPAAEAGDDHRHHGGHHRYKQHHGHNKHHGHHRHHAHRHGHWHSGFSVHVWNPPPPAVRYYPAVRPCHPVIGHGVDQFGRRAKFGGTMCYDGYGNGYVVAGSQHVIHYF
jgi:hypothetical protein